MTGDDACALRAFEVRAVDYLLKPFTQERLQAAVQHARERIAMDKPDGHEPANSRSRDPIPVASLSNREDEFCFSGGTRYGGSKRRRTTSESLQEANRICYARQSPAWRAGWTRSCSCAFIALPLSTCFMLKINEGQNGDTTVVLKNGQKVPMSRGYRSKVEKLLKSQ